MALSIRYQLLPMAFFYLFYTSMLTTSTTVLNDAEEDEDEPQDINATLTGSGQNITVEVGEMITLECPVTGQGSIPIMWEFNGKMIAIGETPLGEQELRSRIKVNGNVLEISHATFAENGQFRCSISVTPPLNVTHYVIVTPPSGNILSPGMPITVMIYEPEKLKLVCHLDLGPKQSISWSHQKEGEQPEILSQHGKIYEVSSVRMGNNGTYKCQKEGEDADMNPAFAIAHVFIKVKPVLTGKTEQTVDATVGDDVKLECKFRGNPPPTVTWMFNNYPYPSGDNRDEIIIKSVKQSEEGTYQCTLNNDKDLTRKITLRVQHKEYSTAVDSSMAPLQWSAPSMLVLLSTVLLSLIIS